MNGLVFVISLVSLALAAAAYWRAGGKEDLKRAQREIQREFGRLKVRQQEVMESISSSLSAAYDASRQRLLHARDVLRQTREEAIRGMEQHLYRAQEQIEALAQRLEEAAQSAKASSISAARNLERAISIRVRRLEARAILLRARAKMSLAVSAASRDDFVLAEQRLEEAIDLLREADDLLADDHAYDSALDSMKLSLRNATTSVQAHAKNIRAKIEDVLAETDRLIGNLESDEQRASDQETVAHPAEKERVAA
jgi:hypothetical protein